MSKPLPKRLVALDAFRGLTIAGMILVNTPGSWEYVYPPLRHAAWHGCTPTDLVFPFFLYIVGVAMFFSSEKYGRHLSESVFFKVGKRALLIFFLGFLLNIFPFFPFEPGGWRIMGVLQRIAVAFFIGALLCYTVERRKLPLVALVILLGYWALMYFGGADGAQYALEGNLARRVDVAIFGEGHVYHGFGIPFDPEGLVSSIPAVATVIIGFVVGSYIDFVRKNSTTKSVDFLPLIGIGLLLLGILWGRFFPINKPLWTSSYVLYTAGIGTLLLSFFLWLIDIKGKRKWANPLVVFGMNPLFIYILSVVLVKVLISIVRFDEQAEYANGYQWLYQKVFVPIAGNLNGSLLFALAVVFVCWFVAWVLYQRRIFIKV